MRELNSKKVLVTGGAGFIGSHLVDNLVKKNCDITVFDHMSERHKKNLSLQEDNIKIFAGDISSLCLHNFIGIDAIFHLASPTFESSNQYPLTSMDNITGTIHILEKMRDNAVLIYASTGSVYGEPLYSPQDENHPCNPTNPHAISKFVAEKYIEYYAHKYNLNAVILRLYNVLGNRQAVGTSAGIVSAFIEKALKGEPPVIIGNGNQKRCFTGIDDVVEAMMLAYNTERAYGETFNIASNKINTTCELANLVCNLVDKNLEPLYVAPKVDTVLCDLVPSITKAQTFLGYHPKRSLENILPELIDWIKKEEKL